MKDITVPPLGESVTEATIATWHKKKGEFVQEDELLLELETDKVTLEVNAPASGVLQTIQKKDGDTVTQGEVLSQIEEGEGAPSSPSIEAPKEKIENIESSQEKGPKNPPAAEKMMREHHINPADIKGTGKDNRVRKTDVMNFMNQPKNEAASPAAKPEEERVPMSRLRQRIAERLKEAQNNAAILTTFNEIDMTNVMNLRKKMQESFQKKHGVKLGFMSFFIKACVQALKEIPAVNAEIDGSDIIFKHYYDIGVAVGTDKGLVVPVVRQADNHSFAELEKVVADLGQRAKNGQLELKELTGGTFSITNGGVYGSLMSTPILNPPQSGILGMHSIQKRPVAIGDKVEIRPMMYVALSYDHRLIDGKEAVTFLVRIKQLIEDPERLLLEV